MNNHICKYCHKINVEMTYDKNEKGMVCFNEREGVPGANNK